jgi:hypothetical protein
MNVNEGLNIRTIDEIDIRDMLLKTALLVKNIKIIFFNSGDRRRFGAFCHNASRKRRGDQPDRG